MITHTSRTVPYNTIRILLTIAAIFNLEVWQKDVTHGYIQGNDMQREVCLKRRAKFKLELGMELQILKPLYELYKSGDSWFHEYRTFLLTKLSLNSTLKSIRANT